MNLKSPLLEATDNICDVGGIRVGHYTDKRRPTGCSVILMDQGGVAAADVRGAAPGTRETDLLEPENTVDRINAIVLAGGSAFGLDAASGVVRYLEEKGIGYQTGFARVPIVPAAILYDLGIGDPRIRPDAQAGYQACEAARSDGAMQGSVGAGAGATVGKLFGLKRAMKGGLGSACLSVRDLKVGALAAVNAVGDVIDPNDGTILAGARTADGKQLLNSMDALRSGNWPAVPLAQNTTLGVVATNLRLTKTQARLLARMSHDGLARSINPVHTPYDGDTVFGISVGTLSADIPLAYVGALAAEALAQAVLRAVVLSKGLAGIPSWQDLFGQSQRG
ncbi:MAG: P1 family peptidase [Acidobacteriota bacterium]